jgi:predicted phosphodiesterase
MKKFIVASDIHGNLMDKRATDACLAFVADFQPEVRVIAGDLFDFAAIRKGAGEDERGISMRDDYEAGKGFAKAFFDGGTDNHLMLGNHDVRVWDMARSGDAIKANLGCRMVQDIEYLARSCGASLIPYDSREGVLELGHLRIVHGYHTGASACASHSRIYGNCLFGHVHSIESYQTPGLKQQEARSIGCLCDLNPDYANRKTGKLRWAHGWAAGHLHADGTYTIFQIREIDGKFYAPIGVKAY